MKLTKAENNNFKAAAVNICCCKKMATQKESARPKMTLGKYLSEEERLPNVN